MSSNKIASSKSITSKTKIIGDESHQNQKKQNVRSNSIQNSSQAINKNEQNKKSKPKDEQKSQDFSQIMSQKEKVIQKLQKQLAKERKNYEQLQNKVENSNYQGQSQNNNSLRPQTANSLHSLKRETNKNKYNEDIKQSKNDKSKITKNKKEGINSQTNNKSFKNQEDGQLNKTLTLTDYELPQDIPQSCKQSKTKNNGYSPLNNYYKSKDWDDQYLLQSKTRDISHINYDTYDNRSYHNLINSSVKGNFQTNKYQSFNPNQSLSPQMHNKVIQNALTLQNQKVVTELQGKLDQILKRGSQQEEQNGDQSKSCYRLNNQKAQLNQINVQSQSVEEQQHTSQFQSIEDNIYKSQNNDSLENFKDKRNVSQKIYQDDSTNNQRNSSMARGSKEKQIFNHVDQQQNSAQSFGIQQKSRSNNQKDTYPTLQESDMRLQSETTQSVPVSTKSGKKKQIDNSIQLYILQNEKNETEIQKLRLQVKILEKELKAKKQDTLSKELQYKTELNGLQSALSSIDRESRTSDQREQELKILIEQLRMKDNEIVSLKSFYEHKLKNEESQFTQQRELSDEIDILKHELNQYNASLMNESIANKQAQVQYVNFVERYK